MKAAVVTQYRDNGWLTLYHDRQVRVVSGPNNHNLCHVSAPGFGAYVCLHQLQTVTDADGQPIVDPDFDPNQKD